MIQCESSETASSDLVPGLVSVIVPNYNHEKYLIPRLESIFSQSYESFEVIILDDASKDNSIDIINAYRGKREVSHVVINQTNSGSTFKQWTRGVALAKGEFIWIAESDDYSNLAYLDMLVDSIQKHPSAGLVFSNSYVVDSNGKTISDYSYQFQDFDRENHFIDGRVFLTGCLSRNNTIPNVSAVLFRKETLFHLNSSISEMKYLGDWLLYIHVLLQKDIVYVNQPLNYHRMHSNSVRSSQGTAWDTLIKEYYIIKSILDSHCISNSIEYNLKVLSSLRDPVKCIHSRKGGEINVALFGAGVIGHRVNSILKNDDSINVVCFIDNNADSNSSENEIPVISLSEFRDNYRDSYIFICSVAFHEQIYMQLQKSGLEELIINNS